MTQFLTGHRTHFLHVFDTTELAQSVISYSVLFFLFRVEPVDTPLAALPPPPPPRDPSGTPLLRSSLSHKQSSFRFCDLDSSNKD